MKYSYFDLQTLTTVLLNKPTDNKNMVFLCVIGTLTPKGDS